MNGLKNCTLGKKLSNSDFIKNIEDHDYYNLSWN
jgi:hypothetical protein